MHSPAIHKKLFGIINVQMHLNIQQQHGNTIIIVLKLKFIRACAYCFVFNNKNSTMLFKCVCLTVNVYLAILLSLQEGVLLRKKGVVTTGRTCTLLFEP